MGSGVLFSSLVSEGLLPTTLPPPPQQPLPLSGRALLLSNWRSHQRRAPESPRALLPRLEETRAGRWRVLRAFL